MTRAQRQDRTHEQLLEAGVAVFLRRGFLAATVEEIAAEAGYTRGAVYKHFGGKEGLWQAIVDAHADTHLHGLRAALDRATSREELLAVLNPAVYVQRTATRWTAVSAEYLAAVAGRPEHAAALAATQRRLDETVAADLDRHCRRLGIRPALPLRDLVVAWGALGGGLALLHAADPATAVGEVAAGVLAVLLPPPTGEPGGSPPAAGEPGASPPAAGEPGASPPAAGRPGGVS
ncbi:TetR family transcriptional regulator [Dactylosporangium aurantiacum]|uniref:TetR family transcriptional regulator n=1 Tax=Dactylosporangium aurantiacum TaxID=35754 RepID=A0A9Q9IUQ5_9ACTN|nr:TetR family transcriptional regulator [Dactylosporangium aurantiacum]